MNTATQAMATSSKKKQQYDYEVAIIGAGFAGIGAGIRLKMQNDDDFIIYEKASTLGGTWRDNTYPGCGCDIPSFLYSYSFEPYAEWSRSFSKQGEILEYLKMCANKYGIYNHIQFNTEISNLAFDKELGFWTITDNKGTIKTARLVIAAAGPFNAANIPNIKGKDNFQGETFHSLHWNHDYVLKDKRVAVIGTGASAIQFVPEIAPDVAKLHLYQRTPPYIVPKPDTIFNEEAKDRFRKYPAYQRFWRELIYWTLEYQGMSNYGNKRLQDKRMKVFEDHINATIKDPELLKQLTPDYEIGCKRILISENYYPTLNRDNVHLVSEGIKEIQANGILTKDGKFQEVDAIIWGTGFYTTKFPKMFSVAGLDDSYNLFDKWNETGPEGYYGTAISDYPNLLFMVGPNSGLGHNSIIHMMESQLNYIMDYLKKLRQQPNIHTYFNLKKEVQDKFNDNVQKQLSKMVWSNGGCKSYYLVNQDGKNSSIWPGSTVKFRRETKKVKLKDYEVKTKN